MSEPKERKPRGKNRKRVIKMEINGVAHTLTWWLESRMLTLRPHKSRHPWMLTPQELVDLASGQYRLPMKVTPARKAVSGLPSGNQPALAGTTEATEAGHHAAAAHDPPVSQQLALLEPAVQNRAAVALPDESDGVLPGLPSPEPDEDPRHVQPVDLSFF